MLRHTIYFCAIVAPTQLLAFDFGKVRTPDWMDQYLLLLLMVWVPSLLLTLMFKPHGIPANRMYMHFGEFNLLGRLIYTIFGLSFTVFMIVLFIGMGLQRAVEAGI